MWLRQVRRCVIGKELHPPSKRHFLSASMADDARRARELWVHLDINKTLIAIDPASGQDLDYVLLSTVGDCMWGKVEAPASADEAWGDLHEAMQSVPRFELSDGRALPRAALQFRILDGEDAICKRRPIVEGGRHRVLSLTEFIDDECLPYEEERASLDKKAARVLNDAIKEARRVVRRVFFAQSGPRERFAPLMAQLRAALDVPAELAAACRDGPVHRLQGGTTRFLIPAFFRLLQWLSVERPNCVVVFRTFGTGESPGCFGVIAQRIDQ